MSQINWIPLHYSPPHYHLSFLGHLDPFSGAYFLHLIPNLSPVYATAQPPDLFPRTVHAPWCLILFGMFDITPLQGQIVPPLARAPCLHVFFCLRSCYVDPQEDPTDSLLAWSPERPSDIFPLDESLLNHSFVGDSHRRRQLCVP